MIAPEFDTEPTEFGAHGQHALIQGDSGIGFVECAERRERGSDHPCRWPAFVLE